MVHPLSDSTTMLTKYQIDHYEDFGFLALRGLLSQEEIEEIRAASSSVMRQLRGTVGTRGDANQVRTTLVGTTSVDAGSH